MVRRRLKHWNNPQSAQRQQGGNSGWVRLRGPRRTGRRGDVSLGWPLGPETESESGASREVGGNNERRCCDLKSWMIEMKRKKKKKGGCDIGWPGNISNSRRNSKPGDG